MPQEDVVLRWAVDPARVELAAEELWDLGATAVEIRGDATLVASFPTATAAESVAARLGARTERIPRDWQDAWRVHARPVEVGDSLVIAPAWRRVAVSGGRLVVEIDPGPCFGNGSHASTRLLLEQLAAGPVPSSVLDVGTGSGILAVVAARFGAESVTAVDIDPEAVAVTAANAGRNGVAARVRASCTPVALVPGRFELALVNVTAGVHAELGADVVTRVRPDGRLLLAGLLPGQWEHVAPAYTGCRLSGLTELDGWVGATLERSAG